MAINGYLQSFSWPNLLPLIHTVYSPDENATLLSFWTTGTNVGNIMGFVFCQYFVLNFGFGWEVAVVVAALYIVGVGLYMGVRIREMPRLGAAGDGHSSKEQESSGEKVSSNSSAGLNN